MLLHEALKYPSLELVVGLELDQVVTRKSFKYFQTQPHFDDDRVEWWFGDATKSLLLLDKDYWQSFDLVLVDLSETVMSMSVTKELDVFDALGLLLKPEGVLVKNELYMDEMSEVFDFTQQIYYDTPIICGQAMVYASNTVDFFAHETKNHDVEALLYTPLVDKDNHLDYLHDYRKNDAKAQGKCDDLEKYEKKDPPIEQEYAAGIIDIVNAENTDVALDDGVKITERIKAAIEAQGFSLLSNPVFANGAVYVVMKEGYVVARLWPDKKYCAFDINVWGNFHKLKSLQAAVVDAVQSKTVSAYRVVVGGMYGSSTWKEDHGIIGPKIIQSRNCNGPPTSTDMTTTAKEMIEVALEGSLVLAQKSKLKSVAFCGVEGKADCLAADLLVDNKDVKSVDKIFACAGLDEAEAVPDEDMFDCEIKTLAKLKSLVSTSAKSKLDLLVVDANVPYRMVQVLHSIFGTARDRQALIRKKNMFIALSTNPGEERWRQQFLDRYRKQHKMDPVSLVHVLLRGGKDSVGFGFVSCGNEDMVYDLESYVSKVDESFKESGKEEVVVELQTMVGGDFPYNEEFDPKLYVHQDYDDKPGLVQYSQQVPLGRQNIFQLVPTGSGGLEMSKTKLNQTLAAGIKILKLEVQSQYEFAGVGDGVVQIYVCEEGSVIGIWDGKNHVDVNFFTYDERPGGPELFIDSVIKFTDGKAMAALRDDQPRGIGRVINFPSDMVDYEE